MKSIALLCGNTFRNYLFKHLILNIMRNNKVVKHSFDILNVNGYPFARITKVGTSYYINEYPEDKDLGRWMDVDSMADYIYSKYASQWRAKHVINLLITGEDYEYRGNILDCYRVVR